MNENITTMNDKIRKSTSSFLDFLFVTLHITALHLAFYSPKRWLNLLLWGFFWALAGQVHLINNNWFEPRHPKAPQPMGLTRSKKVSLFISITIFNFLLFADLAGERLGWKPLSQKSFWILFGVFYASYWVGNYTQRPNKYYFEVEDLLRSLSWYKTPPSGYQILGLSHLYPLIPFRELCKIIDNYDFSSRDEKDSPPAEKHVPEPATAEMVATAPHVQAWPVTRKLRSRHHAQRRRRRVSKKISSH